MGFTDSTRLALGVVTLLCAGCSARTTGPTEVGVRTRRLLGAGIEQHVYAPGGTYLFAPYLSDFATFDITLQNLVMTGAQGREPLIELKTNDGNDIAVEVTVSWRIDASKTPHILQHIGSSTAQVRDRLVRPVCRSVVRDVLNELHSEEYYEAPRRFAKAVLARDRLSEELREDGILIEQVLLGTHRFHADYEAVIRERKIAEQSRERLRSEAAAAKEEQARDWEQAHGAARIAVSQAQGEAQQWHIRADRQYYEHEREAQATLAERRSAAAALEQQRQAMSGPGGRTAVKLRVADALHGGNILVVPRGEGGTVMKLDVNRLFEDYLGRLRAHR